MKTMMFSGEHEDWIGWEENFLARAMGKGYYWIIIGDDEVPKFSDNLIQNWTRRKLLCVV